MLQIEVKKIRKSMGLTQEQFSKVLNISTRQVIRLEQGVCNPHPILEEKLEKLSKRKESN